MNHKQRMKIWRLKDHIKTPIDVANYLEAAVSEGDYDFLKIAVKDVISILHTKIQTDFTLLNWYFNKYNELGLGKDSK